MAAGDDVGRHCRPSDHEGIAARQLEKEYQHVDHPMIAAVMTGKLAGRRDSSVSGIMSDYFRYVPQGMRHAAADLLGALLPANDASRGAALPSQGARCTV